MIDNIFYNNFNETIISGNLITDISEHLAQFIITPKISQQESKKIIHKRCFKNFNEDPFENNLRNINWGTLLNLELSDVNFSFSQLIQEINELLDIHAPFKYFKHKNKKGNKPWITSGTPPPSNRKIIYIKSFVEQKIKNERRTSHTIKSL